MLVVFRVVATVKSPKTFAIDTVYVLGFIGCFGLSHNHDIGLDYAVFKRGRLPEKAFDEVAVVLRKHGGDGVPFGTELEELKVVVVLSQAGVPARFGIVNVAKFILQRVFSQFEILKSEGLAEIKL